MNALYELRKTKPVLIDAHSADIVETDVFKSADGVFCIGHTGEEQGQFGIDRCFCEMTIRELDKLVMRNNIPIVMGDAIGTCVTAVLSGVGAKTEAKRAAVVHWLSTLSERWCGLPHTALSVIPFRPQYSTHPLRWSESQS